MSWYRDRLFWIVLLGSLLFFSLIQFSTPHMVGVDGFYHIKHAQLTAQQGILDPFVWWTASIHSVADGHFLFHILLIPFTFLGLTLGAKVAVVVFATLSALAFFLFLYPRLGRWALIWLLIYFVFGSQALFRLIFEIRPHVGALALLILYSWLLFSSRFIALGLLTFFFVWYYPAFNLLGIMLLLWVIITYFLEKKIAWGALLSTGLGCLLGLVINPFFPDNIRLIYLQVVHVLFFPVQGVNIFPADIQPYASFSEFFSLFWFIFLLSIVCYWLFMRHKLYTQKDIAFLGTWALVNFFLLLRFLRFIEYWVPFTLLFCALVLHRTFLSSLSVETLRKVFFTTLAILSILLVFSFQMQSSQIVKADQALGFYQYGDCVTWLQEHTPSGSVVFTNWYEFPPLFFFNDHNYYIFGEDPHYLYFYNAAMYRAYEEVLYGQSLTPAQTVRDVFGARYVLANKKLMPEWKKYLDAFSGLHKQVETKYCAVYEVI